MNNEVIVVTGGAKGIGKEIVFHFLKKNWNAVVWDNDQLSLEKLQNELNNPKLLIFLCNVADENQVKNAVNLTLMHFGRIDVLVNNAAIMCTKPLSSISLSEWRNVIDVNLSGPFICAKYCESVLREARGSIINICSTRAVQSEPDTEAYSASKGGILALTHSLAISLGPDVRVNAISPGWINQSTEVKSDYETQETFTDADHRQHPVGRIGKCSDIANMVWFLAQSENDFITGQNFIIDGGMTKKMIYV